MSVLAYFLGRGRMTLDTLPCPYLFEDKLLHTLGRICADALNHPISFFDLLNIFLQSCYKYSCSL